MGIQVLQPDINKSGADFAVEGHNIRYALSAIKGVGVANMKAIEQLREEGGPFKDMSDFIHRMPLQNHNRRQFENMIKAGVFDSLEKAAANFLPMSRQSASISAPLPSLKPVPSLRCLAMKNLNRQ